MKQADVIPHLSKISFSIYNYIKENGKLPTKEWGWNTDRMSKHTKKLKLLGLIRLVGYGTWEIIKPFPIAKQTDFFEKTPRGRSHPFKKGVSLKRQSVHNVKYEIRGHGFQFKFLIPKIPNWHKREEFLHKQNIEFDPRHGYATLKVKGWTTWLCKRSIIIYTPKTKSYIKNSAMESQEHAVYDALQRIKWIENLIGYKLTFHKEYAFEIHRKHFAKLDDFIARQFNRKGEQLEIRHHGKLWLLTDYSLKRDEIETVDGEKADEHMDKIVIEGFFNGQKEYHEKTGEVLTPIDIMKMFESNTKVIQTIMRSLEGISEYAKYSTKDRERLWETLKELMRMR